MLKKIYRSKADLANLSLDRLVVDNGMSNNKETYKKMVVKKPWGYEYLLFENNDVAIWMLYIKYNYATSLHCHPKKKTSLIVLDGQVEASTLTDKFILNSKDGLVIDSGAFHSSKSISEDGIFLMEIESPPNKTDLVRLKDKYGRENKGYEGDSEIDYNLDNYNYHYLEQNETLEDQKKKIGNHDVFLCNKLHDADIKDEDLVCSMNTGRLLFHDFLVGDVMKYIDIKEIVNKDNIVGVMGIVIFKSPIGTEMMATEHFLYVLGRHRGLGSIKLIRYAKKWAKEKGCSHIIFNASKMASDLHDNVCKLYERLGMKHFETVYIQDIREV